MPNHLTKVLWFVTLLIAAALIGGLGIALIPPCPWYQKVSVVLLVLISHEVWPWHYPAPWHKETPHNG